MTPSHLSRLRAWRARLTDRGMATVEYAMVTIGAAAFAAVLIAIIRSPEVRQSLMDIIGRALGGA